MHEVGKVQMSSLRPTPVRSHVARLPQESPRHASIHPTLTPQTSSTPSHLRVISVPDSATGTRTLSSPQTVEQLQSFQGVSHDEQVNDFGGNQAVTPPDTQVAAGPTTVLEAVNSSFLLMGRHGEGRTLKDQYSFWATALATAGPNYSLSDPRTVYDVASGRFFVTTLIFEDPNVATGVQSYVALAVSDTSDPNGTWTLWTFPSDANSLNDQPLLGIADDKVVLSWNAFNDTSGAFNGAQFIVVDKAALLAANPAPGTSAEFSFAGIQSMVPAISQTSTTTEYIVYNKQNLNTGDWEFVGARAITGVPTTGGPDTTAVGAEHTLDVTGNGTSVSPPPAADQPDQIHFLDTSDGRMQSVVFSNGNLYTSGSLLFSPDGGATLLSALLVEHVITADWSFQDAELVSNVNLFDPATTVDGNGANFYSFTRSGATRFASSSAFAFFNWQAAGGPTLLSAGVIAAGSGGGSYCDVSDCGVHNTQVVDRWGDYSGIAVDPTNPNDVWVATEYAPSSSPNWATSIGRVTIAQPAVTGISVGSGRTSGATTLTISGTDFDPASSRALFGGVGAESVSWVDPEHLVAVTPPHPAGGAGVQVATADGTSPSGATFTYVEPPLRQGYWLVATDGGIFSYGSAAFHGSTGNIRLNQPIVGMAPTPSGNGYWLVASDGGIFTFGDAGFHGSTGNLRLNKPIVGMAATPDGGGYWLVATDGGIFSFGDAGFHGSTGNIRLNQPIVGMAATATGRGYWLVASDGGIFSFGDAFFHGSAGNINLNKPIVGMTATSDGGGYWLVATDGGIFSYGDAGFHGSTGNLRLNQPIVGMTQSGDDAGYWLVASDGGIFSFGDAPFKGSAGNIRLNKPVVGMASVPA